jgi:four helix bundle protein
MLHTDTRIYRKSLELIRLSARVIERLPRGHAHLADQLRRAASSVTLNFAEGCGKSSARDRRRYFHCARGSANEVVAILDVASAFGALDNDLHHQAADVADHLAAMLSRFR